MSEESAGPALAESVQQVLETMFFISVLGETAPASAWGEPAVGVRVGFRGMPSGTLRLAVSREAASAIASNFLGIEDGCAPESEQIADSLRELANIVCGATLSRLESGQTFEILPPELTAPEDTALDPEAGCAFELDSGSLEATLTFGPEL